MTTYRPEADDLPFVRGKLDLRQRLRYPWKPALSCQFEDHTADVEDNQILTWTLFCVAQSGLCRNETLSIVRAAYRDLQGLTALEFFPPEACLQRLYHRLNEDYEAMHALCRFFLAHSGPQFRAGEQKMAPFLFSMPRLYEMFVAEWLRAHQPAGLRFQPHYRVSIDPAEGMRFDIDLVLRDREGRPICVLDTKYKTSQTPEESDIHQALAYAHSVGCSEAVLVYPSALTKGFQASVRGIRVRAIGFSLNGELEDGRTIPT